MSILFHLKMCTLVFVTFIDLKRVSKFANAYDYNDTILTFRVENNNLKDSGLDGEILRGNAIGM